MIEKNMDKSKVIWKG